MNKTIAVVAPGAMGAAVGARLVTRGAKVLTSTAGRSPASVARARAANLEPASDDALAAADLFLSIVPPDQAVPLAARIAARCAATGKKPIYVDLNAISPQRAREVQAIIAPSGATFVDGGIFGHPPTDASGGPTFYLCGPVSETVADVLNHYGLTTKVLDGEAGTASALKVAYAGITKGLTALATAMILAAERHGVSEALRAELSSSQAELLARLGKAVPDMLPKAYRWVPEMGEIAAFIGAERPESQIYGGMAELYQSVADDAAGLRMLASTLTDFFTPQAIP